MNDLLLPPPAATLIALLITAGLAWLGTILARQTVGPTADRLERSAGFVLAVGICGAAVHGLALAQLSDLRIVRTVGIALALSGAFQWSAWIRMALTNGARWFATLRHLPGRPRAMVTLGTIIVAALGLTAMAPATDVDSLHVYLTVPIDWLRAGGAYARPDLLHARLIGLGEGLTMIGLATGTDALAANLQFAGLVMAAISVADCARSRAAGIRSALAVVASPVMLGLIPAQKFQVLPAAALTVAFLLLIRQWDHFDTRRATLAFSAVAVAMACKYSFLLSGSVVLGFGLLAAARSGRLRAAVGMAVGSIGLLVAPFSLRNWWFYRDPLSPFLETFKTNPDPGTLWLADWLSHRPPLSWVDSVLLLPFSMVATLNPSQISEAIGVAVLLVLAVRDTGRDARLLLWGSALGAAVILALSQPMPRFFLEVVLWGAAAAAMSGSLRYGRLIDGALLLQSSVVALAAWVLAAQLAPGMLSNAARDRVMSRMANGYDEAQWIDRLAPAGHVVLSATRSHALLTRPSMADDLLAVDFSPTVAQLHRRLAEHHVSFVVRPFPLDDRWSELARACGAIVDGPRDFVWATRNPFNRGSVRPVIAVSLDLARAGCP